MKIALQQARLNEKRVLFECQNLNNEQQKLREKIEKLTVQVKVKDGTVISSSKFQSVQCNLKRLREKLKEIEDLYRTNLYHWHNSKVTVKQLEILHDKMHNEQLELQEKADQLVNDEASTRRNLNGNHNSKRTV